MLFMLPEATDESVCHIAFNSSAEAISCQRDVEIEHEWK